MDTVKETTTTTPTPTNLLTGCVKWFNNNLNYGFITVLTEGENHNMDIFSHQSNIKTKRDCFRTLYTGECVQFELAKSNSDKHPVHAINITGFNGCLLHCENPNYRASNGSYRGKRGGGSGNDSSLGRGSGSGSGNGVVRNGGSLRGDNETFRGESVRGGASTRGRGGTVRNFRGERDYNDENSRRGNKNSDGERVSKK